MGCFNYKGGRIYHGHVIDVLRSLPAESVNCVITSPPYWNLRDYGTEDQVWGGNPDCPHRWEVYRKTKVSQGYSDKSTLGGFTNPETKGREMAKGETPRESYFCPCGAWKGEFGQEPSFELYVKHSVLIFNEVQRVLRKDGTLWLNLGDTFHNANLVGIPWRVAFALQEQGWILRSDIIWHKNGMPEAVKNRPTKAHEYLYLLAKSPQYYYGFEDVKEKAVYPAGTRAAKGSATRAGVKGVNARPPECAIYSGLRNLRDVWSIHTEPTPEAHYATFPEKLVEPCVKAGCPLGGVILDPFAGTGTVGRVARKHGREFIGIELNLESVKIAANRLDRVTAVEEGLLDQEGLLV